MVTVKVTDGTQGRARSSVLSGRTLTAGTPPESPVSKKKKKILDRDKEGLSKQVCAEQKRSWKNKWWAIIFLIVFIVYVVLSFWVMYQVKQNSDVYLNIDEAKLPNWAKGVQITKRQDATSGESVKLQPPPVDM